MTQHRDDFIVNKTLRDLPSGFEIREKNVILILFLLLINTNKPDQKQLRGDRDLFQLTPG